MRMRTLAVSSFFSLALLVAPGCEKGGETTAPQPADALSDVDDGKTRLKYPEGGFELSTQYAAASTVSGGAAGKRSLSVSGTIVATPAGDGKFRIELTNGDDVQLMEEGAMKPEAEEGQEPIDNVAKLKGAQSWYVMDRLGEGDDEATKALPENVKRKAERDAAKEQYDAGDEAAGRNLAVGASIVLPGLPTTGLEVGKKESLPTRVEKEETPGGNIELEFDDTYFLRGIENVDGRELATVDYETIGSGAAELSGGQGSAFVALDFEITSTIVFDVGTGLPVSWESEELIETNVQQGSTDKTYEQSREVKATFEAAGAAAPAEAAPAEEAAAPAEEAAAPAEEAAAPAEEAKAE